MTSPANIAETTGDFLQTCVKMAGVPCTVQTNSSALISMLDAMLGSEGRGRTAGDELPLFSLTVRVSARSETVERLPRFRGSGHLVFASFGSDVFVFDLLRRQITATVSPGLASDREFWNNTLLPIALGVIGPVVGVAPLHSACVSLQGCGLLIAGVSGAGKSTLAAALAQRGFDLVSDDWTYVNEGRSGLEAYGLSAPIKLLPDAVAYFPQLRTQTPRPAMNGETAFELDPSLLEAGHASFCRPARLLFLERVPEAAFDITPVDGQSAREFFERSAERLPRILSAATRRRSMILERLSALPCFLLRYGGSPHSAAQLLRDWYGEQLDA